MAEAIYNITVIVSLVGAALSIGLAWMYAQAELKAMQTARAAAERADVELRGANLKADSAAAESLKALAELAKALQGLSKTMQALFVAAMFLLIAGSLSVGQQAIDAIT